jgi:serine protease Do
MQVAIPPKSESSLIPKGVVWPLLHPMTEAGSVMRRQLLGELTAMDRFFAVFAHSLRRPLLAIAVAVALALPSALPATARGPEAIADVAERVIDAVVNISTSQTLEARNTPTPQFFEEFFKNRRGQDGQAPNRPPRRVSSLGSGFVIDPSGIVVTNNHVIAEADEIHVIFNDGTRLKAEIVGRDQKTDLAVLKVNANRPLKYVKFGDSDKLRLGEWVIAIGNPFSLGGSVTAGIVSARNRDINSGPYDNYIQTDAAINRGNSGGPLFNLDGEVVGVNTAIISPTGQSVGIGFAVPSKTAMPIIQQLREFREVRRGWLGVKIQHVTEEIAESLNIKPPRGALVAGVDERGPAGPAGIQPGDVIIRFDGKDIKEMKELPRIVADTPVGKEVEVVIIRKGKEERKTVKLARLEDSEKPVQANIKSQPPKERSTVQKSLGLELSALTEELRKRYKIKDGLKGVVITGVDQSSAAADRRLAPGNVVVQIEQEQVTSPADVQNRIEQMRRAGKKTALLLVASPEGDMMFVALPIN